jgi:type I restriction enzyme R subunit
MLHRKNPPYTIEELKDILAKQNVKAEAKPKSRKKSASTVWMQTDSNMLRDVNDDAEVRKLIHNMMEMDGGTMMKNITSVCIGMFIERYWGMKPNDWRHLVCAYVRMITERPELQETEVFRFSMAG